MQKLIYPILAALTSGILLGLSYWPSSPIVTAFVAIVPLLWIAQKNNLGTLSVLALAANLLATGIAEPSILQTAQGAMGFGISSILMTLPWVLYQLIRLRHNPKLGYIALVSTWLMLEWAQAQWLGPWAGLQLGYAPISLPILVQWYSLLGVTGGSLWLLSVNIQLYRILFPSMPHTRRAGLVNGSLVLVLPLLASLLWPNYSESTTNKKIVLAGASSESMSITSAVLICENSQSKKLQYYHERAEEAVLSGLGQAQAPSLRYQAGSDTLAKAYLWEKTGEKQTLYPSAHNITSILGKEHISLLLVDWSGIKTGMLNGSALLRAELPRLYAKQGATLICGFAAGGNFARLRSAARARAIENRKNIIIFDANSQAWAVDSRGDGQILDAAKLPAAYSLGVSSDSFFANYGDLSGRLSIFVSIWLALATFVKPYRKL